jgi:hypothetical protein
MLAVSGIDHTIKIFSPDARARQVARLGQGVSAHDAASFSSLSWPPRRCLRRPTSVRQPARESTLDENEGAASSEQATAQQQAVSAEEDDEYVAPNGLMSRRRMHEAELITQRNQRQREAGNQEAIVTVSLVFFLPCLSTFPFLFHHSFHCFITYHHQIFPEKPSKSHILNSSREKGQPRSISPTALLALGKLVIPPRRPSSRRYCLCRCPSSVQLLYSLWAYSANF